MEASSLLILEWGLRAWGVFWMVAGIFTLEQARKTTFIDQVLDALQPNAPENPLVRRFLYVGGALTLLSGVSLAMANPWSPLVVGVLVVSQGIYFALQYRRWLRANTEEVREEATVKPATRNAFVVSVVIWGLSLAAFGGFWAVP